MSSSLYDNWDPMGDVVNHFKDVANLNKYSDPLGITGEIVGSHKLTRDQIPCKFYRYDSKSKDCGRARCQFLHARTKFVVPLVLEEIILSNQLQWKKEGDTGILNVGVVVAITDPGDFCIVPYSDWICACKLKYIGEERDKECGWGVDRDPFDNIEITNSGIANLLRLFEDFRQFDQIGEMRTNLSCVNINQVVAVKLPSVGRNNIKEWYRAIVLEDHVLGESAGVPLSLIDYGTSIDAEFPQIALLPRKLLRYPPLGYRCSLNGVSPISHRWSGSAQKHFKDLVYGKDCVFELVKVSYPEDGIFEDDPNLVELMVSTNIDGEYVNLAQQLISEGMGIGWNSFPIQPSAFRQGTEDYRATGIFMSQRACCLASDSSLHTTKPRTSSDFISMIFGVNPINRINSMKYSANSQLLQKRQESTSSSSLTLLPLPETTSVFSVNSVKVPEKLSTAHSAPGQNLVHHCHNEPSHVKESQTTIAQTQPIQQRKGKTKWRPLQL